MKSKIKLAPLKGFFPRTGVQGVVGSVHRTLVGRARRAPRPLRDIDGWSDQSEVAFYEQARCHAG